MRDCAHGMMQADDASDTRRNFNGSRGDFGNSFRSKMKMLISLVAFELIRRFNRSNIIPQMNVRHLVHPFFNN